jgi:glycosyltransferase involved in cell wall biosynthesis
MVEPYAGNAGMRVLHFIGGELTGGAARGAYWLHEGLRRDGVDSRILTNSRETYGSAHVASVNQSGTQRIVNAVRSRMDQLPVKLYRHRKTEIFSPAMVGYDFKSHPLFTWADIIHLHWINGGFVNIGHLDAIKKPVVWTLRDMWPITGGCHVAMDCTRYQTGCGQCPQLGSSSVRDLSRITINRKKKNLPGNLTMVGISHWISQCARESSLFRERPVMTIHNNVNCQDFFPIDTASAKRILDIPVTKKVVLAGAQKGKHAWKGFNLFLQSLQHLEKENVLVLLFGETDEEELKKTGFDYKLLGTLNDLISLRVAYSAADVYVSPAVMEAFGKTIAEAMACGTPAVCFAATGPRDIVEHKTSGYAATPFDVEDLARGIRWVLAQADDPALGQRARQRVLAQFDTPVIAARYKELYTHLLTQP